MTNLNTQEIDLKIEKQRNHKIAAKNTTAKYRLDKLKKLKKKILDYKLDIDAAVAQDFGKPQIEVDLTEVMPVVSMINLMEKELAIWMKDQKIKAPLLFKGTKSVVRYEGKGNCLVISPWNYPFQLTLYPVITSFAAGNTTLLKPSEFTPATNAICKKLIEEVFDDNEVAIVDGAIEETTYLLDQEWDHIFFTGSTNVGKIVMNAASKYLASVSLELGGKSPALVDEKVNLDAALDKLVWGKLVNSGQTCVAPDYILCFEDQADNIINGLIHKIKQFYPGEHWADSKDYSKIITSRHAQRLKDLIDEAVKDGAQVRYGGEADAESRVVAPTILSGVTPQMRVMQEEIFGPVLPVVTFKSKQEMIEFVNSIDNALSMYVFSSDKTFIDDVIKETFNGGVTVNDTLIHVGHPLLPFGGAGKSGIGKYHGEYGFEEFSNLRPVVKRDLDLGATYFYPPYDDKKANVVTSLLKKFSQIF
jgi:aldehyde dehydrogenase (NAD+)